jgi:hypothetical protein
MRLVDRQVRRIVPNDESATASAVTTSTVVTKATAHDYPAGNRRTSTAVRTIAA